MRKTLIDIKTSVVDSAANWDSEGKSKLLKLANKAVSLVPFSPWGSAVTESLSALGNVAHTNENNQLVFISGSAYGDEQDMKLVIDTRVGGSVLTDAPVEVLVRGELYFPTSSFLNIGTAFEFAIRHDVPVDTTGLWWRWEEFPGVGDPVVFSEIYPGLGIVINNQGGSENARLEFSSKITVPNNTIATIYPEVITIGDFPDMFFEGSYIQSSVNAQRVGDGAITAKEYLPVS